MFEQKPITSLTDWSKKRHQNYLQLLFQTQKLTSDAEGVIFFRFIFALVYSGIFTTTTGFSA